MSSQVMSSQVMSSQTMTSQLILMRHAKSSHGDLSLSDHDRPLNPRGQRDSPRMAAWLEEQDCVPELILCSSSQRTRETAELLLDNWQQQPTVRSIQDLYLSSPETMMDVLAENHHGFDRVMVLTHNPGISMLASALAGRSLELVTAAVAVFEVDDLGGLWNPSASSHAPLSHILSHLGKQGDCRLTHFAAPKTI